MPKAKLNLKLFDERWLHSYEEDTAKGQVYRPESWDFPLSRRPREAIELHRDGKAKMLLGGEEDRPHPMDASWSEEAGAIVIRATNPAGHQKKAARRIVSSAPDKLIVKS
jgi:hypothetical protein